MVSNSQRVPRRLSVMRIPALLLAVVWAGSVYGCGAQMGLPINASSSIPSSELTLWQLHQLVAHTAPLNLGSASVYCDSVGRDKSGNPTASIQFSANAANKNSPPPLIVLRVGEEYSLAGVGTVTRSPRVELSHAVNDG